MGYVITSVKIDEDKRTLAKQRGIKLQDLLDEALNMALQLEVPGKAQLEIEKEDILKKIEFEEKQKDEALEKYQRNITELNIRLNYIDKALAGASEEQRALEQLKEYRQLVLRGVKNGAWDGQVYDDLIEHGVKYLLPDLNAFYDQATADLVNVFYRKLTIDDITIDYDCFKPYRPSEDEDDEEGADQ